MTDSVFVDQTGQEWTWDEGTFAQVLADSAWLTPEYRTAALAAYDARITDTSYDSTNPVAGETVVDLASGTTTIIPLPDFTINLGDGMLSVASEGLTAQPDPLA